MPSLVCMHFAYKALTSETRKFLFEQKSTGCVKVLNLTKMRGKVNAEEMKSQTEVTHSLLTSSRGTSKEKKKRLKKAIKGKKKRPNAHLFRHVNQHREKLFPKMVELHTARTTAA